MDKLISYLQDYVVGECLNVTENRYIYEGGMERGAIIEFIDYPRFPRKHSVILRKAVDLGWVLKKLFSQNRVTIVTPASTIMLGEK